MKKLINTIKNIDESIIKVMQKGFSFSFILLVVSLYILLLYITYPISHILYESGLLLFKSSLMFFISFFVCAFAVDKIR